MEAGLQELVSIPTLCGILDVKERTVRGWVAKRQIPYRKLGKLVRFNLEEVRAWYNGNAVKPLTPEIIKTRV